MPITGVMNGLPNITHAFTRWQLVGLAAGLLVMGAAVGMTLAVALFAIAV